MTKRNKDVTIAEEKEKPILPNAMFVKLTR